MSNLIKEKFGESWAELISSWLNLHKFSLLGKQIANLRKNRTIYPDGSDVFKAFRLTSPDQVKVVLLGQDPYHDGTADGLAFSGSKCTLKCPRSLNIMLREIERSKFIYNNEIFVGKLDSWDLSRWAKQGVLLLNTALTVEEGKPGSHKILWIPVTKNIITALNNKQDIIWLLLGNEAMAYRSFITNPSHQMVETYHPAADLYSGQHKFYGSGCFIQVNKCLTKVNKKPIIW